MIKKMKYADFIATALMAAAMTISAATSRAQATTPAVKDDPSSPLHHRVAATALAKKIYMQLASGTLDRKLLTPEESKSLSPEAIAKLQPQLKAFGTPLDFKIIGGTRLNGGFNYKFAVKFADQQHQVAMYVDPNGLVGGYFIR